MIVAAHSFAQNKQFTIAEATNGLATTLAPQSLKQAGWEPGTNRLYHVVKTGNGDAWVSLAFPSGKADTALRLQQLNSSVYGSNRLKSFPTMQWVDKGHVYFVNGNEVKHGIRTADGFNWTTWATLPENAANVTVDKRMNVAYTVDNNLWLITPDKKTIQITRDADKDIVNGQSVHRNEFGIDQGIFLSPEGNYLAYYRMDQRMVADYPIINWGENPAKANLIKYPMAGGTSHEVTLQVYNPTTGSTTAIKTEGPKDQYLTSVTWSPDERYIYIGVLNRDQNHLVLNQYDARSGNKVRPLFEEKHSRYVEPQNPLTFLPGSNDRFIWWSQRDGYMHLYLYRTDGKLVRQLTDGNWLVNEIVGMNREKNEIIITATKESPLEKHGYAVNWNTGDIRRIDAEAGVHTISANEDGSYILDVYTSSKVPRKAVVRSTEGKTIQTLLTAADPLADYNKAKVKNVTLKADDGTPLYGKLILPSNFDSSKKYPVIVYLYNGPHVQLVRNTYPASGNLWYDYLTQRGYVVFTMDGRGSSNRGRKFEQAVFRKLGTVEMNDQLKGVDYLTSLPYVDANRMGVHGWSFGGFMTTSLMLRHPGVFKAAVAGGPVIDWKMYEIMYTERYMDDPKQNPEGFEDANLLSKVKNLKGKLMLIHGTDDDVVVWQHSINLVKKAVDEGVQLDYFVYPGHPHNVRGKDRVHLMQKITDYFDLHLK
ncbi:MAG: S9 family peptidase [Sphingobacteriales bacterium]|nr:MAG: S9 family peptidase [Sphingobacteriales bacterium]